MASNTAAVTEDNYYLLGRDSVETQRCVHFLSFFLLDTRSLNYCIIYPLFNDAQSCCQAGQSGSRAWIDADCRDPCTGPQFSVSMPTLAYIYIYICIIITS